MYFAPHEALRKIGGDAQNRTGDGGFADLCLATWLRRLGSVVDFTCAVALSRGAGPVPLREG